LKDKITEKDLFDYIFFPDLLSKEKYQYLGNSNKFSEEIEFFTELKKSLRRELTEHEKILISKRFPFYSNYVVNDTSRIIHLYPEDLPKKKVKGLELSAASVNNSKSEIITRTFYDDNKTYIIKVINHHSYSKIFVFSTLDAIIKNFEITVFPQGIKYHFDDNTKPLLLDYNIYPEKVALEFNLIKHN
jgi:hypothetical protein